MLSFMNVESFKLIEIEYFYRSLKVSPQHNIHPDLISHCRSFSGPSHNAMNVKQDIVENFRTLERKNYTTILRERFSTTCTFM